MIKSFTLFNILILSTCLLFPSSLLAKNKKDTTVYTSHYFLANMAKALVPASKQDTIKAIPLDPHEAEAISPKLIANISKSQHVIFLAPKAAVWDDLLYHAMGKQAPPKTYVIPKTKYMHPWLSPKQAILIANRLTPIIQKLYPKQKQVIIANQKKLVAKLRALANNFKTGLQTCSKKPVLFAHSSFDALRTDYTLPIISLTQVNNQGGHHHDGLNLSAKHLASLVQNIKKQGIQSLFQSKTEPEKIIISLHEETKLPIILFDTIELEQKGETYLSRMQSNLASLKQGLNCKG